MASTVEQKLSRSLRATLDGLPNGANLICDERFGEALSALGFFIPEVLREIHGEWERESLDGVLPLLARKAGEREVEIVGHCILISDQTLTPFYLCLQLSALDDEVSWLECRLGQRGEGGIERTPIDCPRASTKLLAALDGNEDRIDWAYKVTYGVRRLVA